MSSKSSAPEVSESIPLDPVRVRAMPLAEVLSDELAGPRLLQIDVQGLELMCCREQGSQLALVDEIFVERSFVEPCEGQIPPTRPSFAPWPLISAR